MYEPKYARQVFEAAIAMQIKGDRDRTDQAKAIAKIASGEPLTQADIRHGQALSEIDRAGAAFEPSAISRSGRVPDMGAEAQRYASGGMRQMFEQPSIDPKAEPSFKPNQAQIDWVLEDPEARAPIFDSPQMFGPGAWARSQQKTK